MKIEKSWMIDKKIIHKCSHHIIFLIFNDDWNQQYYNKFLNQKENLISTIYIKQDEAEES